MGPGPSQVTVFLGACPPQNTGKHVKMCEVMHFLDIWEYKRCAQFEKSARIAHAVQIPPLEVVCLVRVRSFLSTKKRVP